MSAPSESRVSFVTVVHPHPCRQPCPACPFRAGQPFPERRWRQTRSGIRQSCRRIPEEECAGSVILALRELRQLFVDQQITPGSIARYLRRAVNGLTANGVGYWLLRWGMHQQVLVEDQPLEVPALPRVDLDSEDVPSRPHHAEGR